MSEIITGPEAEARVVALERFIERLWDTWKPNIKGVKQARRDHPKIVIEEALFILRAKEDERKARARERKQ